MALVDYGSDSDASDTETQAQTASKAPSTSSKSVFQKVVDRSNPGKIKVSLPAAIANPAKDDDGPPTKRAKTGGGAFSGFNSFLPPPKRTGSTNTVLGGANAAKKGLGAGVSFKTGAAPGFSREPEPEKTYNSAELGERVTGDDTGSGLSHPPPKTSPGGVEGQKPAEEVKLVGKPLMFRPLSVSKKPIKKKKAISSAVSTISAPVIPATPEASAQKATRPTVSLFSIAPETPRNESTHSSGEYHPIMNEPEEEEEEDANPEPFYEDYTPTTTPYTAPPPAVPTPPVNQSLDDIAGDLNLSAAERRQLFGRQKNGKGPQSATQVINFNTDQEYLHNEELRASGEQIQHNPVRALAPGKHSLKQLVNAAQSQKDALEESFAKGKNNRAEASSRYGW